MSTPAPIVSLPPVAAPRLFSADIPPTLANKDRIAFTFNADDASIQGWYPLLPGTIA